jgi:two-component system response regulator HydG
VLRALTNSLVSTMPRQLQLLFGTSAAISRALDACARYAGTSYPILILGAPGTGKTTVAAHVHRLSGRTGPFVKDAAPGIPEHLEHSHLGGHARGSFTGAHTDRMGTVEAAHRGTYFLDELGAARPAVQEILLQLLDDGTLTRMGEVRPRPVDVRFVTATNADLEVMIASGGFRQDLRDRLGYLIIRLPTLAERRDEILPLADYYLRREATAIGRPSRPAMTDAVRDCLMAAPWRGNLRELEAVCRFAVLHCDEPRSIELGDLPIDFVATLGVIMQVRQSDQLRDRVADALRRAGGNKTTAARLLGVSRTHLYRLLAGVSTALLLAV